MATYKLIQDIEAEDHILGPLSLRQFIFALIAVFFFYINFILITKQLALLMVLFLPPALFFGFFAMPFGRDQPTEVWALAKLRFWFKPRKRIWDQSGVKELVTITVPKKIERVLTNGLDQDQVQSRLKALASTIDSRGWAIKNVSVDSYNSANQFAPAESDRLVDASILPKAVPAYEPLASEDVLDEVNNPIARQFDQMITQSSQQHRQDLIDQFNSPTAAPPQPQSQQQNGQQQTDTQAADYWFMNQQDVPAGGGSAIPPTVNLITQAQDATADENALVAASTAENVSRQASNSHLRTLQPIDDSQPPPLDDMQYYPNGATWQPPVPYQPVQPVNISADPPMTAPPDPAILNLANNNDLNVATLAREAYKVKHNNDDEPPRDEVVISLR